MPRKRKYTIPELRKLARHYRDEAARMIATDETARMIAAFDAFLAYFDSVERREPKATGREELSRTMAAGTWN